MPETLANGASSTLNGAITNVATTVVIQTADIGKFPASGTYRIAVTDNTNTEIMTVTGGQGTASLTVTRHSEAYAGASTSYAFASGSTIAQVLTVGGLTAFMPAGGTSDFVRIAKIIAGVGGAASLSVSSIAGTASVLRLVHVGRGSGTFYNANLTFNGDTGANYDYQEAGASGASALGAQAFAQTSISCGAIAGSASPTDAWGQTIIEIADYANAAHNKSVSALTVYKGTVSSGGLHTYHMGGYWRSNAAITSVTITPSAGTLLQDSWLAAYLIN